MPEDEPIRLSPEARELLDQAREALGRPRKWTPTEQDTDPHEEKAWR